MWKHKTQYPQSTVQCWVFIVDPCDHVADQELCSLLCWHHQRVLYHMSLAQENHNWELKEWLPLNVYHFVIITKFKKKNLKSNPHKLGTVYQDKHLLNLSLAHTLDSLLKSRHFLPFSLPGLSCCFESVSSTITSVLYNFEKNTYVSRIPWQWCSLGPCYELA